MLQVMQKLAFLQFAYQSDQNQKDKILLRHCQWTISWIPDSLDRTSEARKYAENSPENPDLN